MVILGFPSEAQKRRAWWADEEYQALSEADGAGTTLDFLTLVKGLPLRPRQPRLTNRTCHRQRRIP